MRLQSSPPCKPPACRWLVIALRVLLSGAIMPLAMCAPPSRPTLDCDTGGPCRDSDCDTLCDGFEGFPKRDTDRDGTPDYLDLDSDNDGVPDSDEAGDHDPLTDALDVDDNGIPDYLDNNFPSPMPVRDGGTRLPSDGGAITALFDAHVAEPDATTTPMPTDHGLCQPPDFIPRGCAVDELPTCNGADDDCDGRVDESQGCSCNRGAVRACFIGPAAQQHVGACRSGSQVCVGDEFPTWGPCEGGQLPTEEVCDDLDNDCNGCVDDLTACIPVLSCPGPDDPRIPAARPFQAYELDVAQFYNGDDATSYNWRVDGSPCDAMVRTLDPAATPQSGRLSYQLAGASSPKAQLTFTLSGTYPVELTIETPAGPHVCNFAIPVRAPGLRVELCWDQTGPIAAAAGSKVDLDLHLGKMGTTASWNGPQDCFWDTCTGAASPWGYANTPLQNCQGSQNTATYENALVNACPNPRLDADNRLDGVSSRSYITENINVDAPHSGDNYRIAVVYNTHQRETTSGPVNIHVRPLVNVYCAGQRLATLQTQSESSSNGTKIPNEALNTPQQHWRVADIEVTRGGANSKCSLQPLKMEDGTDWIESMVPDGY